jgi:hypothetical protein
VRFVSEVGREATVGKLNGALVGLVKALNRRLVEDEEGWKREVGEVHEGG